ncbi:MULTISPECIES: SMP-30/gluconolactonase/LRE family protein [unclassified Methylobacterium]|jgi:sugar lactone lactonase YvrE|uniref:SMP-30/gluconolactonase/LRE family protein n=1 Tax=unclassified Methylobacterium TaxID=2615210 RepID=UPI001353C55A|nr:SMP-30/gluconolactonase/LRE family protein [Methylobacterium sp. 2A]MWV22386.1 SMP-30/gluconolactonase/LRE family protein [Methylobacterium sp. 2A]
MTAASTLRCVAPVGDRCGEGLVWCAPEAALYWTDINRFLIHRYDEASDSVRSWLFDEPVVALALSTEPGRLLVALGSRLIWWWPATDRRIDHGFRLPGWPRVRLNDGRADPAGHFWIGSMRNNVGPGGEPGEAGGTDGILVRIAPDGTVTEWATGIGIANTLCWSPDARRFYFGDTLANCIWSYDYAAEGLSNRSVHAEGHVRGLPDGSAIDAAGDLWNCRYGGGCILRIGPDGRLRETVDLPVPNITTATFGGADLRTLYVTTASGGAPGGHRLAGSLFALRSAVPGLPENRVRIA